MINVMTIARLDTREQALSASQEYRFEIDPDEMYPAAIEHVREALERPAPSGALGDLWRRGRLLPINAWEMALIPRDEMAVPEWITMRAEALEVARLWFTELLHAAVGYGSMGLHILKDDENRWRL